MGLREDYGKTLLLGYQQQKSGKPHRHKEIKTNSF